MRPYGFDSRSEHQVFLPAKKCGATGGLFRFAPSFDSCAAAFRISIFAPAISKCRFAFFKVKLCDAPPFRGLASRRPPQFAAIGGFKFARICGNSRSRCRLGGFRIRHIAGRSAGNITLSGRAIPPARGEIPACIRTSARHAEIPIERPSRFAGVCSACGRFFRPSQTGCRSR